ncbi:MAG: hypothetical protein U5L45_14480 [Saprospiraceae bacterium]|nr:hypothetical protein [Saprospiraceae bacterium]
MTSKKQTKLITGIHNYCDNWCERCPFTSRCAVGLVEYELTDEQKHLNNEAFWRNLSNNFAKTLNLLQEEAGRKGLDLKPPTDEELQEFEKKHIETRDIIQQKPLIKTSEQYMTATDTWIEAHQRAFENKGFEFVQQVKMGLRTETELLNQSILFGESIEVLQWYSHLIKVKFIRAFHGQIENDSWEEQHGFPKDSDGSAKVALIGAERSLAAWVKLATIMPELLDSMLPMMGSLQKIIRLGDAAFPNARLFVRAGFDETST